MTEETEHKTTLAESRAGQAKIEFWIAVALVFCYPVAAWLLDWKPLTSNQILLCAVGLVGLGLRARSYAVSYELDRDTMIIREELLDIHRRLGK